MPYIPTTYTDSVGQPIEVEVLAEKEQIGIKTPTITLRKIPSENHPVHIVKVLNKYNKNDTVREFVEIKTGDITAPNQFKVDYANRMITFHESQKGLWVLVDFYALGFYAITADEVIAKEGNNGECIQTLRELIDSGQDILHTLELLGGASEVHTKLSQHIDNGLTLIPVVEKAELIQYELSRSVFMAQDLLDMINSWLQAYADVVDLEARVDSLEKRMNEIAPISRQLSDNTEGGAN